MHQILKYASSWKYILNLNSANGFSLNSNMHDVVNGVLVDRCLIGHCVYFYRCSEVLKAGKTLANNRLVSLFPHDPLCILCLDVIRVQQSMNAFIHLVLYNAQC
jgi:hypothetical protein